MLFSNLNTCIHSAMKYDSLQKKLISNIVEAIIMTGHTACENNFIPKIPIIPSDLTFQFKHLQFPVRLTFAMKQYEIIL